MSVEAGQEFIDSLKHISFAIRDTKLKTQDINEYAMILKEETEKLYELSESLQKYCNKLYNASTELRIVQVELHNEEETD